MSVTSYEPDPDETDNTDSDANEVWVDISLVIDKAFDPTRLPQAKPEA